MDRKITWGLLGAWAINDAEELATMAAWSRRAIPRLRARHPRVPEAVWSAVRVTGPESAVAIGLMGALVAAAAWRGHATGGRSPFYQAALVGFGAHAATHVAFSALARGYTPGVLTAPTVVAPYSIWALAKLRGAGVRLDRRAVRAAMPLLGAATIASHVAAKVLVRRTLRRTR